MACVGDFATGPQMISDPEWSIFLAGLDLPRDVRVASGGKAVSTADPGQVDLDLDLCLPDGGSGMYDLLPVATDIARALKPTDLGSRTATLTISCVCPGFVEPIAVRDPHYLRNPWDGTPSAEAELTNWEKSTS